MRIIRLGGLFFDAWRGWRKPIRRPHKPSYNLLLPIALLLAVGALMQFVMGPAILASRGGEISSVNYFFWRHLFAIIVGLIALFIGFKVNLRYWLKYSPYILLAGFLIGLLAVVSGGGTDVRWLQFQSFSLQPAEILKLGFILVAAGYLHRAGNAEQASFKGVLRANLALIVLVALLGLLILVLQKDYGSMFIIGMAFLAMLWVSGLPSRFLWGALLAMAIIGTFFIAVEPHRRQRLVTFNDPTADCQDAGYQICQALIGVGSGGLTGRGFGGSVQIYGYLPEANNDSIFAIYAELAGFIGTSLLIGLILYLLLLIHRLARQLEDSLMLVAVGAMIWIGVQSLVNIAGILNLIPLKGITLPLISFGGTSLVLVLLMSGILLQLSAYTIKDYERRSYQSSVRRRGNRRPRNASRLAGGRN